MWQLVVVRDAHGQVESFRTANSLLEADRRAQHEKIRELEVSAQRTATLVAELADAREEIERLNATIAQMQEAFQEQEDENAEYDGD